MKKNLVINLHVVKDAQWLENLLIYLKSKYKPSPLSVYENADNYKKHNSLCHLTFDDGDRTFYEIAFPLLKKHNFPATIFVSPASVTEHFNFWFQEAADYNTVTVQKIFAEELNVPFEKIANFDYYSLLKTQPIAAINKIIAEYQSQTGTKPKPFRNMNLAELLEVQKSDLVAIGAHTLHHPILPNETAQVSENEIIGSINDLEKLLNAEVRYFAYPNGRRGFDYGEREIEILKKTKIKIALTTEPHFVNAKTNPLEMPRIGVTKGDLRTVTAKLRLASYWEKLKYLGKKSEMEKKAEIQSIIHSNSSSHA